MPFTIPNEADAAQPDQAEPDSVDFDILTAASLRTGVVTGCAVTAQVPATMTLDVAAGTVEIAGTTGVISGTTVAIGASGARPRYDIVVAGLGDVVAVVPGTPGTNPVFPAIPASRAVLAAVHIPAAVTEIDSTRIVDKRVMLDTGLADHLAAADPHDLSLYLLADGSRAGSTGSAQDFGSTGITADVIAESTGAAGVTVDGVIVKDSGLTVAANIVMGDNSVTGIDTLVFTDLQGTIAGVQNQNLLDKAATESISGVYTHTVGMIVDGTADEQQLRVQGHSTQTSDIFVVEQSGGISVFVVDTSGGTLTGTLTISDKLTVEDDVFINGTADEIQLTVQGHSTQTNNIFVVEQSDGTDLLTVDNSGNGQFAGTLGVTGATTLSSTLGVTGAITASSTLTMGGNIVMADNSITGIDTLTFTDTAGTIAGIQNQNLLDKTAAESISGAYTHTVGMDVTGSADEVQLTLQGYSTQTSDIFAMKNFSGTEVLAVDNSGNLDVLGHMAIGATATVNSGRVINVVESAPVFSLTGVFSQVVNTSSAFTNRDTRAIEGVAIWGGLGTASGRYCMGLDFEAQHKSANTLADLIGIRAVITSHAIGTGAVDRGQGILIDTASFAGDVPDAIRGIYIKDQTGTVTVAGITAAIDIEEFALTSGAGPHYGIRIIPPSVGAVRPIWINSAGGSIPFSGFDGQLLIDDNISLSSPTEGFAVMLYMPMDASAQAGPDGATLRVGDGLSTSVTATGNDQQIYGVVIDTRNIDDGLTGIAGIVLGVIGANDGTVAEQYCILEAAASVSGINAFGHDTIIGGFTGDGSVPAYPTVSGRLHVHQEDLTGAKPCLFLDQRDVSEQGIIFSSAGSDIDINLFTVNVTGAPVLLWDEAADEFSISKGWRVAGQVQIGGNLNHDGSNIGFFGTAPAAQAAAYTQTFATADRTHAADGSSDMPAGGVGAAAGGWDTAVNRDQAIAEFAALRVTVDDLKQLVNAVVDDLQSYGLVQ